MAQDDGRFTKLGARLYDWIAWRKLSVIARYLWIAIYTCADGKNSPPGLYRMSVRGLAEAAAMQADEVNDALDELVEHGFVEVDLENRVIRLCMLPDRHEAPQTGYQVKGIHTKWKAFPDCPIVRAHVDLLRWLCEGAHDSVQQTWGQTFATVPIPVKRRRGRQRFDSDTSTETQPSLFFTTVDNSRPQEPSSGLSGPDVMTDCRKPHQTECHSSAPGRGEGIGVGSGSDLILSGIGETATVAPPHMLFREGSVRGEVGAPQGLAPVPMMTLVPPPDGLPFTAPDMLHAIAAESSDRFAPEPFDGRLLEALHATIRACTQTSVGLADLRVVGRWFAAGGLAFRSDLGPAWVAKAGNLLDAVGQSRAWVARGSPRLSHTIDRRVEPAPPSAFGNGRRQL